MHACLCACLSRSWASNFVSSLWLTLSVDKILDRIVSRYYVGQWTSFFHRVLPLRRAAGVQSRPLLLYIPSSTLRFSAPGHLRTPAAGAGPSGLQESL